MTSPRGQRPAPSAATRRAAAVVALVALAAAIAFMVAELWDSWQILGLGVPALSLMVIAAWYALSHRGLVRTLAIAVAGCGLLVLVVVLTVEQSVRVLVVVAVLSALSAAAARTALSSPQLAGSSVDNERPPTAALHPVLLMNLRSGGGKAERFDLVSRCRERGIEAVVLRPEDDLLQLAQDAVARGADLLGMAGGDGSQALVASVSSRHGIPYVVVPAGTRNHFALDLGLDREDVVGALDAYADGVDRVIDLAEVNGRVFVNNASIGVYATIVQSEDYRDAKMKTAADLLPDILGPGSEPLDLRFTLPSGEEVPTCELLLVSNNAYELHHLRGAGTRLRLDSGGLGIVSVRVRSATDANALAALEALGQVQRYSGWKEWTAPELEVRSGNSVRIGVDGEALVMQAPLRFRSLPGALTVRLPRTALGQSPAARAVRVTSRQTLRELWQTAVGRGSP